MSFLALLITRAGIAQSVKQQDGRSWFDSQQGKETVSMPQHLDCLWVTRISSATVVFFLLGALSLPWIVIMLILPPLSSFLPSEFWKAVNNSYSPTDPCFIKQQHLTHYCDECLDRCEASNQDYNHKLTELCPLFFPTAYINFHVSDVSHEKVKLPL
jgi:hypothetical protein